MLGRLGFGFLILFGATCSQATVLNFEQLPDYTNITNQYGGVVFNGVYQIEASDTPGYTPHSGTGFVANLAGQTMSATFLAPQGSLSAWYMDVQGMTVTVFDTSNNLLSSTSYAATSSNTFWSYSGPGIGSVSFTGGTQSIGLDDFAYATDRSAAPTSVTPEPVSLLLLGTGLLAGSSLCVYRSAQLKRDAHTVLS